MCNIYLSICMVFLFNVVVGQSEFSCSSLRSEGSIVTKQDTALKGHVRQSLAKVSFIQCGLRCQRHQWCISINFQIATGQCELNDYGVKDETSAEGEEFEKRQGFVYSQLRPEKFGCQDNTCQNGGTCRTNCTNWQTVCICKMGFVGNKCEVDLDECSSNPCKNGGSCSDQINGYNCTCVAGYNGTNCENDIDECSSNPCKNGGSCSDRVNGYNCTCVAGFIGKNCETNINECSSSPCKNGGTCKDQINGYNCTCLVGFAGKNCELNIIECASSPCQNGGSCLDKVNSYKCTCLEGYNGTNCEIKQNACELYWKDKSTQNYVSGAAWLATQDLSSFTVSVWLKVPSSFSKELVPFSYLTSSEKDALWIKIKQDKKAEIKVMGDAKSKMIAFDRDETWQHIAITWERKNVQDRGTVIFYHNGKDVSNDKDLSKDDDLKKGGILIIGQKQGSHGSGFDKDKLMVGHMTLLNIWSRVFTINEVQALSKNCTSPDGDVVAWSDVLTKTLKGSVKKICPSNCT